MMERDFMGLNSKDSSLIVVKEEAAEASQDHSGSGVQWPLSSKISALPHFMSFNVAQENKTSKVVSDTSRFMSMSSADAFGVANEIKNAHSVHLHQDMKMLQSSNPFFKTQYATGSQNFTGATIKQQQLLGGNPVTAPHSVLPSIGSFAGTTEAWFNAKSPQAAQLTIFYGGTVNVYENISPEKAQAIMLLAGTATLTSPIAAGRTQAQVPTSRLGAADAIYVSQPVKTQPCSALSSPISVSSHPIGPSGGGPINIDETVKPSGVLTNAIGKVDLPKVAACPPGSIAMSSMISSAVPQARKASLARFLEKRKERCMNANPYSLGKDSAACTGKTGSNGVSFSGSSGVSSSGNEAGVAAKG